MKTFVALALLFATTTSYAQVDTTQDPNAGNQEVTFQRYAIGGKKSILGSTYSLKMDCSPTDWQQVTVIKSPENGDAKLVDQNTFANYNAPNPRVKCNGKAVKAKALEYIPTKGYIGDDAVEIEAINDSGQRIVWKFHITVK
jgi:hypothetical protein